MTTAHTPTVIKLVSFDVWNTLITYNPEFSEARYNKLAHMMNLPLNRVKESYTKIKKMVDTTAEVSGEAWSTIECYHLLVADLYKHSANLQEMKSAVESLFKKYPPIIHDNVRTTIKEIKKTGCYVSIGSNSNFISGEVMLPWLESELGDFEFGVFSDLLLRAKPDARFFNEIIKKGYEVDEDIAPKNIMHVGDNYICDGHCYLYNINPLIIKNPSEIPSVLRYLEN